MKKKSTPNLIDFHHHGRKKVVVDFDGGTSTSDAGALHVCSRGATGPWVGSWT